MMPEAPINRTSSRSLPAAFACTALALSCAPALAQDTTLYDIQVSIDGQTWVDQLDLSAQTATTRVLMRAAVSYQGPQSPFGFASCFSQPVFRNMRAGLDSILPFANQGNNGNGGAVDLDSTPLDGPFGRLRPFASSGPSGTQSYQVHEHTAGSGEAPVDARYLRIARNDITRWPGAGPTTGTLAANNFNGAGGINTAQKSFGNVGPTDPPFVPGFTSIAIMQFGLDIAPGVGAPGTVIDIFAPVESFLRDSTSGARYAQWFSTQSDNSGSIRGTVTVDGASIIVPAPAAAAVLLGLGLPRRRRT
ncbi:MAG: hypothetical protein JSR77_11270 [Planctomycetes bacterium]|nr:hypothetical protein [Planctomycetota bacterium]